MTVTVEGDLDISKVGKVGNLTNTVNIDLNSLSLLLFSVDCS